MKGMSISAFILGICGAAAGAVAVVLGCIAFSKTRRW